MYVALSRPFAVLDRSNSRYSNLPIGALVFVLVFLGLNPKVKGSLSGTYHCKRRFSSSTLLEWFCY